MPRSCSYPKSDSPAPHVRSMDEVVDCCESILSPSGARSQKPGQSGLIAHAIDEDGICPFCELGMGDCSASELTTAMGRSRVCHRSCYNGARSLQRLVDKLSDEVPDIKAKMRSLKEKDRERYKSILLSLRSQSHGRSVAQRTIAKQFIVELAQSTTISRKESSVLLNFRQFMAWHAMNEQLPANEAKMKWDFALENPNQYKEFCDGIPLVAVELPTEICKTECLSKRRKLATTTNDMTEPQMQDRWREMQQAPISLPGSAADYLGAQSLRGQILTSDPGIGKVLDERPAVAARCRWPAPSDTFADSQLPWTPLSMASSFGSAASPATPGLQPLQALPAAMGSSPMQQPQQQTFPAALGSPLQVHQQQPQQQTFPGMQQQQLPQQQTLPAAPGTQQQLNAAAAAETPAAADPFNKEPEEDTWDLTDDQAKAMTMQGFISFKKSVRRLLADALKEHMSPVRGKTWSALIQSHLEADPALKIDPDLQQLSIDETTTKMDDLAKHMKDLTEKIVAVWKFKDLRQHSFIAGLQAIRQKKDAYLEHLEEVKQMHSIIKDMQAGLRKDQVKARKQVNYKIARYAKVLAFNGFPETTARHLAKAMSAVVGEGTTFQQVFGNLPSGVAVCGEGSSDEGFRHLSAISEKNADFLFNEASSLVSQMKGTAIMKPLTLDNPVSREEHIKQGKLYFDEAADVMKPWLLVATALSSSWGQLRWPVMGLPARVLALDDYCVVGCIPTATLVGEGLSADKCDWLESDRVKEDDLCVVVLRKGEGLALPIGMSVLWAYCPANGTVDKPDKACKGKLLLQWSLLEKPTCDSQIAVQEVTHSFGKLMALTGTKRPWSGIKDDLGKWLADVKVSQ